METLRYCRVYNVEKSEIALFSLFVPTFINNQIRPLRDCPCWGFQYGYFFLKKYSSLVALVEVFRSFGL